MVAVAVVSRRASRSILTQACVIPAFAFGGTAVAAVFDAVKQRGQTGGPPRARRHHGLLYCFVLECIGLAAFFGLGVGLPRPNSINEWPALVVALVGSFALGVQNALSAQRSVLRFPTTGMTLNLSKLVDAATSFVILHTGLQQMTDLCHLKVPTAVEKADPWRTIVHRRLIRYTSLMLTFVVASVAGAASFQAFGFWSLACPFGIILFVTADCYAGMRGASVPVQPVVERWAAAAWARCRWACCGCESWPD